MALIPALRDHRFYLTDDSAAQFLPSWYHLGELLRSGQFPLLDPTLWAGGNIAAEALFGIWNPVLLATMVFVSLVPNLVVASVVVKAFFLVLLALGVYGLAREYDVPRGFSAVAAVTVPVRRGDALLRRRVVVVRASRRSRSCPGSGGRCAAAPAGSSPRSSRSSPATSR